MVLNSNGWIAHEQEPIGSPRVSVFAIYFLIEKKREEHVYLSCLLMSLICGLLNCTSKVSRLPQIIKNVVGSSVCCNMQDHNAHNFKDSSSRTPPLICPFKAFIDFGIVVLFSDEILKLLRWCNIAEKLCELKLISRVGESLKTFSRWAGCSGNSTPAQIRNLEIN